MTAIKNPLQTAIQMPQRVYIMRNDNNMINLNLTNKGLIKMIKELKTTTLVCHI
jgi:hypothetical protein